MAGNSFTFTIPESTFYDREDGNTRKLQLSLNITSPTTINTKCWFRFNSTSQTLDGLPYAALVGRREILKVNYQLTATDSCGLSVADNISLILNKAQHHCFEMTIAFKTKTSYDCEWVAVKDFVEKLAAYYGFTVDRDISIIDYSRSKKFYNRLLVKLSFLQTIIKCSHCESKKIANITYKVLHKENSTVHRDFNSFLSPSFEAINVLITGVDACAAYVLPLVHEQKSKVPVLAWLLPVLIFSIALALTMLFALCRYCGCCSCCVCIFPVDEDEDYFMRKECPPRRHHTYREFIGSDFDQVYPSMRKNRAGQLPNDASFESVDDIYGSGSDDGILPPPPFRGKEEVEENYGKENGLRDSGTVRTIIYATPSFGKEATEMSIFSGGREKKGGNGDAVNIMYHNIAETPFQGSDDDGYKRTHGSFESLLLRRASSVGNIMIGSENPGFSDVSVDNNEHGMNSASTVKKPSIININSSSQMQNKLEGEVMHTSSLDISESAADEQLGSFEAGVGVSNLAYNTDDDNKLNEQEDLSIPSRVAMQFGSHNENDNLRDDARLSFEGDISSLNGERKLPIASVSVGAKRPQFHFQSNVTNKALMHEYSSSTPDTESKSAFKGRRNAMKTNQRARTIITGVDSDGLLCDDKVKNVSELSWVTFNGASNGMDGAKQGSSRQDLELCGEMNHTSSTSITLHPSKQENKEEPVNETCHIHLSSGENVDEYKDRVADGHINGRQENNETATSQECVALASSSTEVVQSELNRICPGCNSNVPCSTNSESNSSKNSTVLADHSKEYLQAGNVLNGVHEMKPDSYPTRFTCLESNASRCKNDNQEGSYGVINNHDDVILSAQVKDQSKHHACITTLPQPYNAVNNGPKGDCEVCMNNKRPISLGSLDGSKNFPHQTYGDFVVEEANKQKEGADTARDIIGGGSANQNVTFSAGGNSDPNMVRGCYQITKKFI